MTPRRLLLSAAALIPVLLFPITVHLQEKLTSSYASVGATNSIWNIAREQGFYKKHGLDVEVVYIGSTTISAASLLSGNVHVGMVGGNGVANAAVQTSAGEGTSHLCVSKLGKSDTKTFPPSLNEEFRAATDLLK